MQKDPGNLLNLRNLMKRDPEAYHEEFLQRYEHFRAQAELLRLQPLQPSLSRPMAELVEFLSHVAPSFRSEGEGFPALLMQLLEDGQDERVEHDLLVKVVQALLLLQNRGMVVRMRLLPVLFRLMRLQNKAVRMMVFTHVVQDARRLEQAQPGGKEGRAVQRFVLQSLRDENRTVAKRGLQVLIDLWRRRVWRDERTANCMADACFSPDSAIMVAALRFFCGLEDVANEEDDELDISAAQEKVKALTTEGVAPKRKRANKLKRAQRAMRQAYKKESAEANEEEEEAWDEGEGGGRGGQMLGREAIELVFDPQHFAERLFSALRGSNESFEVRMLMMNVISRFISVHKLLLLNFYPFLQKYMQPHQKNVTALLSYLAQACHPLVPPDVVQPCVRTLAQHFVTDRSSPEVMAVGLNAIRECCARCPLAMTSELLQDLVEYRSSKVKGVIMAARSLLALYRQLRPELLLRKDRGREAAMRLQADSRNYNPTGEEDDDAVISALYGQGHVVSDVPGAQDLANDDGGDARSDDEAEPAASGKTAARKRPRSCISDGTEDREEEDEEEGEEEEEDEEEEEEEEDEEEDGSDVDLEGDDEMDEDGDEEDGEGDEEGDDDGEGDDGEGDADEEYGAVLLERQQPSKKVLPAGATRIFSDEDFRQMRLKAREKRESKHGGGHKRGREAEDVDVASALPDSVDPDDIAGPQKRAKQDYDARRAKVLEGREGREKYGAPKEKGGGTTNKEKLKNQPFMLVKQSRSIKSKQSGKFTLKQRKQSTHIRSLKSMSKKVKRKIKRRKM